MTAQRPTLDLSLPVGRATYALRYQDGVLVHLGFSDGQPAPAPSDPWRFVYRDPWEPRRFSECAYGLDGAERLSDFELVDQQRANDRLVVVLLDRTADVEITLDYRPHGEEGIVVRRQTLANRGSEAVTITAHPSFRLHCPADAAELWSLYGAWGDEANLQATTLPVGTTALGAVKGKTGFEHVPWFELRAGGVAWFGELAWSGNWELRFERHWAGDVTITGGLHPMGYRRSLAPGESITSPAALLGFARGDGNAVSQALHAHQRRRLLPRPERLVPVQFNSWYPRQGRIDHDSALRFIDDAAALGCEVFVLDAGWYANAAADADAGWEEQLGDWLPDPERFQQGLEPIAEHARRRGLGFGIWLEPEVATSSSRVFREHPEWFHARNGTHVATGPRRIIDLGQEPAWQWVHEQVSGVLRSTGATWLKWDFNAELWQGGDRRGGTEDLVAHVQGLYAMWDALRDEFPDLVLESCASGGGRLDAGVLARTDVSWMSDMVSPLSTLGIRCGLSHAFCAKAMNAWIVHWPPAWHWHEHGGHRHPAARGDGAGDLDFRARVAMMGAFGVSSDLARWAPADVARLREHIAAYKSLRRLILHGRQFRLTADPPRDGSGTWAAMAFVAPAGDRAAVFAFRLGDGRDVTTLRVPGLQEGARYAVRDADRGDRGVLTGAALRELGLAVELPEPFRAALLDIALEPGRDR